MSRRQMAPARLQPVPQYWVLSRGKVLGPLVAADVHALLERGDIRRTALVRCSYARGWYQRLHEIPELVPDSMLPPAPTLCAQ